MVSNKLFSNFLLAKDMSDGLIVLEYVALMFLKRSLGETLFNPVCSVQKQQ